MCQIAKKVLRIEKVIGVAGSAAKCRLLISDLGCDVALNYKDGDFFDQLCNETPEYIDLFFDNVGGQVLDCALMRMAKNGKIVSCGSVSSYDDSSASGVSAKAWSLVVGLLSINSLQGNADKCRRNSVSVSKASYSSTTLMNLGLLTKIS